MGIKIKNTVSLILMVVLLFSTIGVNIISSLCVGCQNENKSIALLAPEKTECQCCSHDAEATTCCHEGNTCTEEHHHTESKYAQLKIDLSDQGNKWELPIVPVVLVLLFSNLPIVNLYVSLIPSVSDQIPPPESCRTILSLICILRN